MTRVVVVGVGTGIGKTHLGVALVTVLARQGEQVVGLKPIESGIEASGAGQESSDGALLAAAGTFHVKHPQPYAFPEPVSPHLAARKAGVTIDLDQVCSWVDAHPASWSVVETAGALLSPLGGGLTNLDLARALAPDALVLVAVDRLGVLHEVSACQLALRVLGASLPAPLVVLQAPEVADASTGTNAEELERLGIARQVRLMPRGDTGSTTVQAAAAAVLAALRT